ncbi:MAG TPA: hypothetical protein VLB46_19510 [Pyrinomonadaceae bacterium]|nr:hypothetical protein [Pyrinomonadaceae bacterium]
MSTFAFVLTHRIVLNMVKTGPPRAWDGTGHFGVAQVYDQSIFPDTFGWISSYFGGMPFPNFYPPLFFWLVSFLHHTHLFSFPTAFKLMIFLPILIMPAIIWLLAWVVSNRDYGVAFWASFLSLFPLVDPRFGGHFDWSSGLDYFSTFAIGMYTQPLGFVLLVLWFIAYSYRGHKFWRFALSSVLLALAVLANYLNGITSTLFIAATLVWDVLRYLRADSTALKEEARRTFISHTLSPVVSLGLTLFWLVPMFSAYRYLVTRPYTDVVFTGGMGIWYAASIVGVLCWRKRSTYAMWPYVLVCLVLINILVFAKTISPSWYPLQANRLSPTLNFLLSVPVGYCVATIFRKLRNLIVRGPSLAGFANRLAPYAQAVFLILLLAMGYVISQTWEMKVLARIMKTLSFYPSQEVVTAVANQPRVEPPKLGPALVRDKPPAAVTRAEVFTQSDREHAIDEALSAHTEAEINAILRFAQDHRDGSYLVEFPDVYDATSKAYDARALNSFLGVQGNETVTVVFREASTSSVFMYPQVNALSFNSDSFGISSVLSDDLDFFEQPLERHLARARLLGAKYLVVHSPVLKERLAREASLGARHDFEEWTVFELKEPPPPKVQLLPYRPALLVSDFTVKGRYSNQPNFLRFAEEQFADGWFDVRLAHAPQRSLDSLGSLASLNQFGAIILDTYDCRRCELVYRQLREYAQHRSLILLMADDHLFDRIRSSIHEFPNAQIVERTTEDPPVWLDNEWPRHRYNSSAIRRQWSQIREILERHKVPVEPVAVGGENSSREIRIDFQGAASPQEAVPVLINTPFHPNWQNGSGNTIYKVSPMFMLTFVKEPTSLQFARNGIDYFGLYASAVFVLGLAGYAAWHYRGVLAGKRVREPIAVESEEVV